MVNLRIKFTYKIVFKNLYINFTYAIDPKRSLMVKFICLIVKSVLKCL